MPRSLAPRVGRLWCCLALGSTLLALVGEAAECEGESCSSQAAPTYAHHWPHNHGHEGMYSTSTHPGPPWGKMKESLAFRWHHPAGQYHTVLVGAAIMDHERNFYIATIFEIRKISREGKELWTYVPGGDISNSPGLMGGVVYGTNTAGMMYAVDIKTGKEIWKTKVSASVTGDTSYVEGKDGIIVAGVQDAPSPIQPGGNPNVIGVNATDGKRLWGFTPDVPTWNIMAMFTDEGNFVFQTQAGTVYCLKLQDGSLVWRNGPEAKFPEAKSGLHYLWTDGGATVGSNGIAYVGSNLGHGMTAIPGGDGTPTNVAGYVHAYNASNGKFIWGEVVSRPMMSWPAVGRIGPNMRLATVSTLGTNPGAPGVSMYYQWLPDWLKLQMHHWSIWLGDRAKFLWWNPGFATEVVAMDAATGQRLWTWTPPVYPRLACKGDEEALVLRMTMGIRSQCMTASWGAPSIGGDGVVYAPHMNGMVYAIKDINGNGIIEEATEVTSFDAESAFLHGGPTFAPGTMAVTTCDSLWVWNT
mmetsp:Transcript_34380/g.109129  ORF Transcript_34380/g.109129 Transcript_34380/m.109129 type:complete len:526 (-) Transcript_34380:67-1644(-)